MNFDLFAKIGKEWWDGHLQMIHVAQKAGRLIPRDSKLLYPSIMLATKCRGYYILELIGSLRGLQPLKVKIHKERSIYRYLNQFEASTTDPFFVFDSMHHHLGGLSLARSSDREEALTRFPHLDIYPTHIQGASGGGSVLSFGQNFRSLSLERCAIVNARKNLIRCKSILWAAIVRSNITEQDLIRLFEHSTKDDQVHGVYVANGDEEKLHVAGQLQSMFLMPGLRETTIGEFIQLHPEIIKKAFNSNRFEYEPYLEWKEHDGSVEDTAINPDLMIQRGDGFFDIYDLKTALLNRLSITKAERRRRRFIDCVEDGVSQLANYREYFEYPRNAEYAKMKYGIEVNSPKLVLVVGSFENSYPDQISQACRKYANIEIVDYDTLCHMYIGAPD